MSVESLEDGVLFGVGAEASVPGALVERGAQRVLLIAQGRHTAGVERLRDALGDRAVGVFVADRPQVPGEVADAVVALARETRADWVLAHGGGRPIGIAKAVALELGLPIAAVPTTYAGSERTDIWGLTRDGVKQTGRDSRVRPSLVAYDPALFTGLPVELSLMSLVNALAHSIEALYAVEATDAARQAAEASLAPLVQGMRAIHADPAGLDGRSEALRGSYLASTALNGASMALHHKLAHVLGGSFGTSHALTHSTLLSYTFGFNAPASDAVLEATRTAWNTVDPPAFLYDLQRSLGVNTSLKGVGIEEVDLPAIAEHVLAKRYDNPRPYDREALIALLTAAWHDRRPSLFTCALPIEASGPHATQPVALRGAALSDARAVVVAVHGRGASADRFLADLERRLDGVLSDLTLVAPQAHRNTWYPHGFLADPETNEPGMSSALAVLDAVWDAVVAEVPAERIVLVGFSQGACLLLTWLATTTRRPTQVLAFTGAHTPLPTARFDAAAGTTVHMSRAEQDPWVPAEPFSNTVARLREAGATVAAVSVPGDTHRIHDTDDQALARAVEAAHARR